MSGWSLDVTGVPVGRKFFCLRSGPTRTRVVYATRSVKDPAPFALGRYRPNASLKYSSLSKVLGCVLLLLHLGLSDGVRDFWSRLLPDHTPFDPSAHYQFSLRHHPFFEPSLTQLTCIRREIFQARSPELTTHPATTDPSTNLAKKGANPAGAGPPHPADWTDEPKTRSDRALTSRQRRRAGTNTIEF